MKRNSLIRLIALFLVAVMSLTSLAACSKDANDDTTENDSTEEEKKVVESKEGLSVEKVGTFPHKNATVRLYNGGVIYSNDNTKYGITSFDGTKDSGAIYAYCSYAPYTDNYFIVSTKDPDTVKTVSDINCCGLVDVNGNVLIPEEYALIKVLNERYVRVCKAEAATDDPYETLIYCPIGGYFQFLPDDNDSFTGTWYIYDVIKGEKVDGATGTQSNGYAAYGNYVVFTTDDGKHIQVNHNGNVIDAYIHSNGAYEITDTDKNVTTVYDSNDSELFTYNRDEMQLMLWRDKAECFHMRNGYGDDGVQFLVDINGNTVTAEFSVIQEATPEYLLVDDGKLCDYEGNQVIEGSFTDLIYDTYLRQNWIAYNDEEYVVFDIEGNVLYRGTDIADQSFYDGCRFYIKKEENDTTLYYNYGDKSFSIEGYDFAPWIVENYPEKKLVETRTGKTIIKDYEYYYYENFSDNTMYIYAKKDGVYDIYRVK